MPIPIFVNVALQRSLPRDLRRVDTCRVYVDGQTAPLCFEADEGAGVVICAMVDHRGRAVYPDHEGDPLTYTLHGLVTVEADPRLRAWLEQHSRSTAG